MEKKTANSYEAVACGAFELSIAGYSATPARAGDGRNTVTRVESGWAALGLPPGAAAYTDVSYSKDSSGWTIAEADVFINAEDFMWVPFGGTEGDTERSLQAILTHEVGHVLGLLHPCEVTAAPGIPACSSNPAFQQTMMYPIYDGTKLALSQDDINGLCSIYGCSAACPATPDAGSAQPVAMPAACTTEAQCALGQTCRRGSCVDGDAQPGDPCTSDHSCAIGTCTSQGYCALGCGSQQSDAAVCPAAGQGLGERCSNAGDCSGAVCLKGAGAAPICSRECLDAPCPSDWICASVSGKNVCAPPGYTPAGAGCSFDPGSRPGGYVFGLLYGLICLKRRRCRRTPGIGARDWKKKR